MAGDICAICCGTERERSVHCPLDCEYLREARRREPLPEVDPETFPNKDIRISEKFLRDQEPLLLFVSVSLLQAALEIPDAVDSDLGEALEALAKTYRTMQSGLYYQSRPDNPLAAAVVDRIQAGVDEFRKRATEQSGMQTVRDADILGILIFLQRMQIQQNNGRRLGRAFVDFLRSNFPQTEKPAEPSSLIV